MKVLGIRFCAVAEEAVPMSQFFTRGLGLPERDLGGASDTFQGCVIPAGDCSWVEIWQKGENMPAGLMLQIVVMTRMLSRPPPGRTALTCRGRWRRMARRFILPSRPAGSASASRKSSLELGARCRE